MKKEDWKAWIRGEKQRMGLTNERLAVEMDVSETTVKNLLRNTPKCMENVVMLALLFGKTLEECNHLLQELGFHRLYAKTPGEAIWIYLLERGCSTRPAATYREYSKLFVALHDKDQELSGGRRESHRALFEKRAMLPQVNTVDELSSIIDMAHEAKCLGLPVDAAHDTVFREKAVSLLPGFETPYQELYKTIYERLCMCSLSRGLEESLEDDVNVCLVDLFGREFSSRFSQIILTMLRDGRAPGRPFLIALGLRLDMTVMEIDALLQKAGYGPLTGRGYFEAVLTALLEELEAYQPFVFSSHLIWELPAREVVFPKERRPEGFEEPLYRDVNDCTRFLSPEEAEWQQLDTDWEDELAALAPPEMELDGNGMIPEVTVADYIKRRLEGSGLCFEEDADTVQRFLQLISED